VARAIPGRTRFLSTFVNEMYAILLGLGMAEVLFSQDFKQALVGIPDNPKQIHIPLACLFCVAIVLTYWSDWAEDIEKDVRMTAREFVLDFLILLNLELFFVFLSDGFAPVILGYLLLSLAFWDALWVVNYVCELGPRRATAPVQCMRWVGEKVLALVICSLGIAALYLVPRSSLSGWAGMVDLSILVVTFISVRLLCFNQVRRKKRLRFRKAHREDVSAIVNIHNQHVFDVSAEKLDYGFLLERVSADQVSQKMTTGESDFFVAVDVGQEVVAYAELYHGIPDGLLRDTSWHTEQWQSLVRDNPCCYIECVAVRRDCLGRGVGHYVYRRLRDRFPGQLLAAFIVISPRSNTYSVAFHRHEGFVAVGRFKRDRFRGLQNYESSLMLYVPRAIRLKRETISSGTSAGDAHNRSLPSRQPRAKMLDD
jgi:L-amino acid N-acyltransferase YncA